MTDTLSTIRSRGYWRILIRPQKFDLGRVANPSELRQIVRECSVRLRGWDFPRVEADEDFMIMNEYVQQAIEWEHFVELWRMYKSGQFVYLGGIASDWRDRSQIWPAGQDWRPGAVLGIRASICRFQEAFEFASRLSQSVAGSEVMHVELGLCGLRNRALQVDVSGKIGFSTPKQASTDEWRKSEGMLRHDLIATSDHLALDWARQLFWMFGWDADIGLLRDFNGP